MYSLVFQGNHSASDDFVLQQLPPVSREKIMVA
jgi:hypothetical protein